MLSRLARPALRGVARATPTQATRACVPRRLAGGSPMIPPTQYDIPLPRHAFHLPTLMRCHWEITPIIVVTAIVILDVFAIIIWSFRNKVDCKYEKTGRTISDSMDLCRPTVHKILVINQEYLPWPELAEVLADMEEVEQRQYRILLGKAD